MVRTCAYGTSPATLRARSRPTRSPKFSDVVNTQDSRALLDEFAFGGTYEFAIVRLNAPKSANRNALEVPVRAADDEEGNRRRRMMRQINSISATQDAKHAIVLCADGGCLYYNKCDEGGSEAGGSLIELPSLPRNMVNLSQCTVRDWTLRRVGYHGEVVLLHATQVTADTHTRVVVKPIYLENEHVAPTLPESPTEGDKGGDGVARWTEWGYFKNPG